MNTHSTVTSILGRILLVAACSVVLASRPARAEEIQARKVGVGYKIGNGIGFAGGDVVLRLVPHVVFDLQASYASIDGMTGYGLAPTVQLQLKEVGHTPYLGVGIQHARLSDENRGGYATGFVANAGYEWRFASGVGVIVGGGVQDLGPVHVTKGTATPDGRGTGVRFNLEAGVRYFF
jgi:hypothetical protein